MALSAQLMVAWAHLLEWDPGLQPGRPVLAQWSTLARLVTSHHSQLLTLAVLLVVKARAKARARLLRVARTVVGVAQADFVVAPLQRQAWLLTWHHAHLSLPCRLGSNKFLLAQRPSLLQCH